MLNDLNSNSNILLNFRGYFKFAIGYTILAILCITALRSAMEGHRVLPIDANIRNFEERDNIFVYCTLFFSHSISTIFSIHSSMFSISCFVLFSTYAISQLELIAHHVENLPLNDIKQLADHLSDITELHLNVLR